MKKQRIRHNLMQGSAVAGLLLLVLWIIFPVYVMGKISLSPPGEILSEQPTLMMHAVTGEHWARVLSSGSLWQPLGKSVAVALCVICMTLVIGVPGAYGIARMPLRIRGYVLYGSLLSRMLPEVAIAQPIAEWCYRMNAIDNVFALASAHSFRVFPIVIWMLYETFKTIPIELEEQAAIDGCSFVQNVRYVLLPLSMGGMSVAAIFSWLFSWDEFTYALYLSMAEPTLPLKVYYYLNRGSWFSVAAYSVLITVPVVIITYALQKHIREGCTAGAVKG